jgi:predicted TIM-barrel fold metal-dependent hydrolase
MKADCHVHILDPDRFPYRKDAIYLPAQHETAAVEQLIDVFDASGITHGLVVTPMAGYQSDNSVTLDALSRYPKRLRGIAVVEADVTEAEVDRLVESGVAGIRIDLIGRGTDYVCTLGGKRLLNMMRDRKLITQIQYEFDQLAEVGGILSAEAGLLVIDHAGRPDVARGSEQPGFKSLLKLAEREHVAVKLSGPFRFSRTGYPFSDTIPYMRKVFEAFGASRCVWGSDWPFLRASPRIDYGPTLSALESWIPDEKVRHQILWTTPARIFGFTEETSGCLAGTGAGPQRSMPTLRPNSAADIVNQ